MQLQHRMKRLSNNEPDVDQGFLNGFWLSYNPDDELFYVEDGSEQTTRARFKHFRNAVQFARRNEAVTSGLVYREMQQRR
jgi:hypothetical protein